VKLGTVPGNFGEANVNFVLKSAQRNLCSI